MSDRVFQIIEDIATALLDPAERTVLIVEDDDDLRQWLATMLTRQKFVVSVAARARHGILHIATKKPRVVVTDKNLPDASGVDVVREGRLSSPETEFLIMTGDPTMESAIDAANLGVLGYVRKPFNSIDDVVRPVRAGLERLRLQRVNGMLDERLRALESELLTARIELGTMETVVKETTRQRAEAFRDFLTDVVRPLKEAEADVAKFGTQRGSLTAPGGLLDRLEHAVQRVVKDVDAHAQQLADDASRVSGVLEEP